jgi:diguanylate cyclase (GGDEF)-like protein
MSRAVLRRASSWLAPLIVALVVLSVGARLITLSVRARTQELRTAAETSATRHAARIGTELQALLDRAQRPAQNVSPGREGGATPEADTTPPQGRATSAPATAALTADSGTFRMGADGSSIESQGTDEAVARAIASEWASSDERLRAGSAGLFGPVRYGSQWIAVARAALPSVEGAGTRLRVAYESLDGLLARAKFGSLVNEGYDFRLFQIDSLTRRPRVFVSSGSGPLESPVIRAANTAGRPAPASADYLSLAIRPRTGWYPARELATEIGLLTLLAWAFAFGAYDLTHSLGRARDVLTATRNRLHRANERLVLEMEQRQTLQESFEHVRFHDPFTGLPNRRYFMDQLDRALRDVRTRRRQRIALFLIDIDRFKLINDTLGHTAGDELLLQAAQRFARTLSATECLIARWGGDQLAVLAYDVESMNAARGLARQLQDAGGEPFELRQHRLGVTSRIGFTCIDSGLQRTEDAMREADLALSVAKHQGMRTMAYASGMGGAAVSLVSLEADLHVALDRNEFRLLFQPIVDLRLQRVVGAEALLRWRHPVEGLLTPDKFLAIAEEAGVIVPVTRWVIQRVCRLAAEWRRRLPQGQEFYISVNLSAAVLRNPGLRDYIARTLSDTGTPVGNLKFELTERGLISNVGTAREVLDAFHNMGIELMLDDFGSGYSSLSYLQLFPFDYVKIDRPFASRTGSERANNAITSAILQMTSSLGLRAVAEVVETKAAAQALLEMGCEYGQGYFFSEPVEAEEALRQLLEGTPGDAGFAPEDDSPTLILPPGVILESKIKDEAASREEPSIT